MFEDTRIGGASRSFPTTRRSAILGSCSPSVEERRQALDTIVAAYWKPVYAYVRFKWRQSNEDAKDLTQAFFARAMEKEFFKNYDPEKASFRTFVRTCVDHFVINESKYAQRLKRGGETQVVALEEAPEPEAKSLEEVFEKEWIRSLFTLAVEDLRELCSTRAKQMHFEMFERYTLNGDDVSYGALASQYGVAITDVTNYLAWCRREFRRLVMERIRALTIDDDEFRREAKIILGRSFGDLR
jgi:RNA polymerase sigma factor (sigma-70 family)